MTKRATNSVSHAKNGTAVPRARMHCGGPIEQYLSRTGKSRDEFENALQNGNSSAVALFSAEVLFGEIQRLVEVVSQIKVETDNGF